MRKNKNQDDVNLITVAALLLIVVVFVPLQYIQGFVS